MVNQIKITPKEDLIKNFIKNTENIKKLTKIHKTQIEKIDNDMNEKIDKINEKLRELGREKLDLEDNMSLELKKLETNYFQ